MQLCEDEPGGRAGVAALGQRCAAAGRRRAALPRAPLVRVRSRTAVSLGTEDSHPRVSNFVRL